LDQILGNEGTVESDGESDDDDEGHNIIEQAQQLFGSVGSLFDDSVRRVRESTILHRPALQASPTSPKDNGKGTRISI
jgi:hypothetical protein